MGNKNLFLHANAIPQKINQYLANCYRHRDLKMFFWEYSFIMNKHNQKPTDMRQRFN